MRIQFLTVLHPPEFVGNVCRCASPPELLTTAAVRVESLTGDTGDNSETLLGSSVKQDAKLGSSVAEVVSHSLFRLLIKNQHT